MHIVLRRSYTVIAPRCLAQRASAVRSRTILLVHRLTPPTSVPSAAGSCTEYVGSRTPSSTMSLLNSSKVQSKLLLSSSMSSRITPPTYHQRRWTEASYSACLYRTVSSDLSTVRNKVACQTFLKCRTSCCFHPFYTARLFPRLQNKLCQPSSLLS